MLGVALGVTVLLAAGLGQLNFATGQDSYLNKDTQVYDDNERYQSLFGGQAMLTLFTHEEGGSVTELFTEENIAEMRSMEAQARALDGVIGVISPVTALEFTNALVTPLVDDDITSSPAAQILVRAQQRATEAGDDESAAARAADSAATLERLLAVPEDERTLDNPEWVELLLVDNAGNIRAALRPFFPSTPGEPPVAEETSNAQMVTRLLGNASIDEESETTENLLEITEAHEFEDFSTLTTGAPVLLKDINDYLQGGMLTLGGIAVLVMLVVLSLVFRVRSRLLPLATVLVATVWIFGLLGFIGFELSLVTIAGLPILIGMGIDFAIQVHNRVEEELLVDHAAEPFGPTTRWLGPPLVVAAVAAAIAFICMQISAVPMVRDFGVMLAMGIVILLVAALTVTIAALGLREHRKPSRPQASSGRTFTERLVVRLGALPQVAVVPLIVLAIGLFAFGILAEDAFEIETDPQRWVDQDTQVIHDLALVEERTGSTSELGIYIEADDVFAPEVVDFTTELAVDQLDRHPDGLLTASSIYTTTYYIMDVPGAEPLLPTAEDVELAFSVAPDDVRLSTVADEREAGNLIFRVGPGSLEDLKVIVDELEGELEGTLAPPPDTRATPSGLAVVGVGLLENVEANRTVLTYAALGAVALWLLVRFRSVVRAMVAIVPVTMAVGTASLVVALVGFRLSPLTTISGPLVIATCTGFASLILARYLEERERGMSPRAASAQAGARTGKAFVASALTTVGGFGVLVFSELPLLSDFGAIVALNVSVALLAALVVQPPLLVWADRRGWLGTTAADGQEERRR